MINGKIPLSYNVANGTQVTLGILVGTNGQTTAPAGTLKLRMRYVVTKRFYEES